MSEEPDREEMSPDELTSWLKAQTDQAIAACGEAAKVNAALYQAYVAEGLAPIQAIYLVGCATTGSPGFPPG